jgi:protease YdgD
MVAAGAASAGAALPLADPAPGRQSLIEKIAVFGDDNRTPLPRNMLELRNSIGLITSETEQTLCSGFCVGRRTVATAAHCLFRTAGERRPDLTSFRFLVGPPKQRRIAGIVGRRSSAIGQHVVAGSYALRITPPIQATRDWALMRLDRPVCAGHSLLVDNVGPKHINRIAARRRLMNVAFHGDTGNWQLTLAHSCATASRMTKRVRGQIDRDFADTSSLVLHECDTGPASSGSPLLALGADNVLRVVAMNVGSYHQTRYLLTGRSVKRRFKPATVANTAVSGQAFADQILAFTRADILSDRQSVRKLQMALRKRHFDPGPADGIFGEQTRSAVVRFERATGRQGVGLATHQLLRDVERWQAR